MICYRQSSKSISCLLDIHGEKKFVHLSSHQCKFASTSSTISWIRSNNANFESIHRIITVRQPTGVKGAGWDSLSGSITNPCWLVIYSGSDVTFVGYETFVRSIVENSPSAQFHQIIYHMIAM